MEFHCQDGNMAAQVKETSQKFQQIRYIQSNVQRLVIRLKGPPLSNLDPVDG